VVSHGVHRTLESVEDTEGPIDFVARLVNQLKTLLGTLGHRFFSVYLSSLGLNCYE
jgi:hypothetical protein